ncbi:MAG TPA: hypothetical protein VI387_02040 [Candidatus Brocadiales bacterium]|nr:hypothetical protein [Candidatus Brocadiales bacterium]
MVHTAGKFCLDGISLRLFNERTKISRNAMKYSGLFFLLLLYLLSTELLGIARADTATETFQPSQPQATVPQLQATEEERLADQRLLFYLFKPLIGKYVPEEARQDLGLKNFFTSGWNVGWGEPYEGPNDAPRFRLLRIQRAFWERELRFTYTYASGADEGTVDEQEGEFELELPISRRFLIEFEGGFVGVQPGGDSWRIHSGDLKIIPEVMLMETKDVSFSLGTVVRTPTGGRSVGEGRTSLTPYLAFWKDLGMRIGLHSYMGTEFQIGGFGLGAPDAIVQYGIAPSFTVTPKDTPYLGNLTFFGEVNGETSLGGADDQTKVNLLPGVRWLLFKDFWVAGGYEFPITDRQEFDNRIWVSIYRDF